MNWPCALMSAGLMLLPLSANSQTASKARKPLHTAAPLSAASNAHPAKATNAVAPKRVSAGSSTHVRGRKGTSRSRVKKAAAPSYQLHPDPERYQQIQQSLTERGFYKGQANGSWNDDSVQALRDFQSANKLDADGKINALTLMKLGLGPKHDGSGAPLSGADSLHPATPEPSVSSEAPLPPPPTSLPPETDTDAPPPQ